MGISWSTKRPTAKRHHSVSTTKLGPARHGRRKLVYNQLVSDGTFNYSYDHEGNRTVAIEIATGNITRYGWDVPLPVPSVARPGVTTFS